MPGDITEGPVPPPVRPELAELGLVAGDRVRWRDRAGARPREGTVTGRERDGSVGVRDGRGASRALRIERLEVAVRGPRGGHGWEPLADRVARQQQMPLWSPEPAGGRAARPPRPAR
jgi:hypothetical protein